MAIFTRTAVLALLCFLPATLPAPVEPLVPRTSYCPARLVGPFTYEAGWNEDGEPAPGTTAGVYLDLASNNYLIDDDNINFADSPPVSKRLRRTDEVVNRDTADVAEQSLVRKRQVNWSSKSRIFEASNYAKVALQSGILMIVKADGTLENILNILDQLPGVKSRYAADHILELNMPLQWLNEHGDDVLGDAILNDSPYAVSTITQALNCAGNLMGIDGIINGLKMLLLQKNGPARWTDYPSGVYQAVKNYMDVVQPAYMLAVKRVAQVIDDVACDHNLPLAGAIWTTWATGKFTNALALIAANAPPGTSLTSDYTLVPRHY